MPEVVAMKGPDAWVVCHETQHRPSEWREKDCVSDDWVVEVEQRFVFGPIIGSVTANTQEPELMPVKMNWVDHRGVAAANRRDVVDDYAHAIVEAHSCYMSTNEWQEGGRRAVEVNVSPSVGRVQCLISVWEILRY